MRIRLSGSVRRGCRRWKGEQGVANLRRIPSCHLEETLAWIEFDVEAKIPTYGELYFSTRGRGGGEAASAIDARQPLPSAERPEHLMPQHVGRMEVIQWRGGWRRGVVDVYVKVVVGGARSLNEPGIIRLIRNPAALIRRRGGRGTDSKFFSSALVFLFFSFFSSSHFTNSFYCRKAGPSAVDYVVFSLPLCLPLLGVPECVFTGHRSWSRLASAMKFCSLPTAATFPSTDSHLLCRPEAECLESSCA